MKPYHNGHVIVFLFSLCLLPTGNSFAQDVYTLNGYQVHLVHKSDTGRNIILNLDKKYKFILLEKAEDQSQAYRNQVIVEENKYMGYLFPEDDSTLLIIGSQFRHDSLVIRRLVLENERIPKIGERKIAYQVVGFSLMAISPFLYFIDPHKVNVGISDVGGCFYPTASTSGGSGILCCTSAFGASLFLVFKFYDYTKLTYYDIQVVNVGKPAGKVDAIIKYININ